jgi:hypothetical protein
VTLLIAPSFSGTLCSRHWTPQRIKNHRVRGRRIWPRCPPSRTRPRVRRTRRRTVPGHGHLPGRRFLVSRRPPHLRPLRSRAVLPAVFVTFAMFALIACSDSSPGATCSPNGTELHIAVQESQSHQFTTDCLAALQASSSRSVSTTKTSAHTVTTTSTSSMGMDHRSLAISRLTEHP